MKVIDFLKQNKELFQKPVDQINWEKVYELALDDFKAHLGKFTEFWLNKNIHVENYLSELPRDFLYESKNITSFVIPDNITSIGHWAFRECSRLTSITISNSVKSIESEAFHYCRRLTNIALGNGVESIGSRAFSFCDELTNIIIPDSVTSIDFEAFSDCDSLRSIEIPDSVINMGSAVFWNCGENLIINYKGTKAQFRVLTKGCFPNTYFTAHCADGDIVKKKR